MKALIIDEPWIGLILSGSKTWEMRKTACNIRGVIGLIRKGTGQVVGTAEIVASERPLATREDYAAAEERHRIPPPRQETTYNDGWRYPWVLTNASRLPQPVPYSHPSGAVIWVNLDPTVAASVRQQSPTSAGQEATRRTASPSSRVPTPAPRTDEPHAGTAVSVILTGGNIRNNHIYLASVLDHFPADAIGGPRISEAASKTIRVTFLPGSTVDVDIDGTKKILRARSAVGDFFGRTGARAGDRIRIERTAPYEFVFSVLRD